MKVELEEEKASNITKIKMCQNPASDESETYELNTAIFKIVKLEEFLALMKNFRTSIDGKRTTSVSGKVNYLRIMLRGEALLYVDKLASLNSDTKMLI